MECAYYFTSLIQPNEYAPGDSDTSYLGLEPETNETSSRLGRTLVPSTGEYRP